MNAAMMTWGVVAFAGGAALGGFFFGGLWVTVHRVSSAQSGSLVALLSFVVRTVIVVLGVHWLMRADWRLACVSLAGFLFARSLILRWTCRSHPDRFPLERVTSP